MDRFTGDGGKDDSLATTGNPQGQDQQNKELDIHSIPDYRKQVNGLQGTHWQDWSVSVGKLKGVSPAETHAYKEIFAAEGGFDNDQDGSAASGITKDTLDRAIKDGALPDIKKGTIPADLTIDQRAKVYRSHFDDVLRTVDRSIPGSENLQNIGNKQAATAFADTMFAHGRHGGADVIQKAINKVAPGSVNNDKDMGAQTFKAYKKLASAPTTRRALLSALGDARWNSVKLKTNAIGWVKRIDHFRP